MEDNESGEVITSNNIKSDTIRTTKCPDTPSECNLVIDDDYEENLPKRPLKRNKAVKNSEEPTRIPCTWDNCNKVIYDYINFINHVEEHAHETEYVDDMLICGFEACEYATKNSLLFGRHLAFHSYHERLKNIGMNVVERQGLPKCTALDPYTIVDMSTYECRWYRCEHNYNTIHEFINHMKDHTNKFPKYCAKGEFNKCEWLGCNLKFATQYKLIDHMRTHSTEKMIACPTCGNMFSSKTRFADHRKRQIPIELHSYQCSECSKLFSTERILRDHMRSHINHYKCNMCDMTCSRPSMLANHIRFRHMTERPFKCSLCEHTAVTKCNLEHHLTTHCAENIFACEYCTYRCRSLYGLESHLNKEHLQENQQLYECHCCKERFPRGANLTRHLIKVHDYNWPSGHSRFKYKQETDGLYRLQTVRYESLEVTQEMMTEKAPNIDNTKYEMTVSSDTSGRIPSFVLNATKVKQDNMYTSDRDVVIDIKDLDDTGNVVKSEVVIAKEIIHEIH